MDSIKKYREKKHAFEMRCYQRIKKMKWMEKVRNEEVLKQMGMKEKTLLQTIMEAKRKFIECKTNKDKLFRAVTQGLVLTEKEDRRTAKINNVEYCLIIVYFVGLFYFIVLL